MSDGATAAAGVNSTPGGFAIDVDISAPTPASSSNAGSGGATPGDAAGGVVANGEAAKAWLSKIPAGYEGKPWVNNLAQHEDPMSEMFKQMDNQLSLIGRKAEGLKVPGENATPEDWANFNKAIGVPDKVDGYQYTAPTVPDDLKPYFQTDDNLVNTMKEAALKAGIRPEGFKHITEVFDNYYVAELQKAVAANKQLLDSLDHSFQTKFGERSGQVLDTFQKSIVNLGKEQASVIEALDPRVKVVLAEHFENFAKNYVREDRLNLGTPNVGSSMTEQEYGNEYERLYAAVRNSRPGSAEHSDATSRLKALRSKAETIFNKG